jgi:GNAT superfamily N-acetyltransferase
MSAKIEIRELGPELWSSLEKLFGQNGACGGCWCMFWRIEDGERYQDVKGDQARTRQRALIRSGRSRGLLAFVGAEPVGWCAYGPRSEFPRLGRSRTLACDDPKRAWSIPCFFVKAGFRGRGVARALLRAAVESVKREGAEVVEGYPVRLRAGERARSSDAFTGTVPLFASEGFRILTNTSRGRQRARRTP